jgi:PAS domain S-box-containing protein
LFKTFRNVNEPNSSPQSEVDRTLREDQRRLSTLLSNLPGMAYRCKNDRAWTMEFVSDGCEALTGYKATDLVGAGTLTYNSLIHPDDRDRVWNEIQDALSRGHSFRITYRTIAADGREKWVWEQGVGIYSGAELQALEGFITDITDRKATEARLQAQNERFQNIIDNTDAGFFRIGLDGCYEVVNPAWLRMYGFECKEDAIGLHFSKVHTPEDAARAEEVFKSVLRGESVRSGESARLRRDGTLGHHSFSANPVLDGSRVAGMEGFLIDISARKAAEQERRRTEQRYELISENATDVIWLWDLEIGHCVYVSPSVQKMRGFSPREIMLQPLDQTMPPDAYRKVNAETQRRKAAVEAGDESARIDTNEIEYLRKDGTTGVTETVTKLLSDERGTVRQVLGVSRDITERKQAECAQAKLEAQLRHAQKMESVGRLAGGVAHDFNNLLTVINGYSEFLLSQLNAPGPLRSYAQEIRKAGERAASLTKQLLAFSRKQVTEPRVLDLNTTIKDSAPFLQRLIGEDVALTTRLDGALGQVIADPDQIGQVLMNLVVNARDAMPEGGKLDIETKNVEFASDNTAISPDTTPGRYVLVSVTDTGLGMDETTQLHIFEPFFTTKEAGKGTGLGLSTVYGIIRQSGGWIDVSSQVGSGTAFKLYLPRIDAGPMPERNETSAPTLGGSGTILLVEDQEAVRTLTKAVLRQYGYQVIEAFDGEEAIAVASRFSGQIHLLLTDVILPGMNGKQVSERLKGLRPDMKVLFMSGYAADVIAHRGALDRGVALLRKPFSPEQLAAKVRDVLAHSPESAG